MFVFNSTTGTITGYIGNKPNIVIPAAINGVLVKSIGNSVFAYMATIKTVAIPDTVTSIGDKAFYGCIELTKIKIPNSVTTIGNSAFEACVKLNSIKIPNSVTSVGSNIFLNTRLNDYTGPGTYTAVKPLSYTDESQFDFDPDAGMIVKYNGSNKVVIVPETIGGVEVKGIMGNSYDRGFAGNNYAEIVVLPDTIESISNSAFINSALKTINIPNGITKIANSMFILVNSLISVSLPDSVTTIESYAFSSCQNLKSINFPENLKVIAFKAFASCPSIEFPLVLPSSVTTLGDSAFVLCTGLTKIVITESLVPSINSALFWGTSFFDYYSGPGTYVKEGDIWIKQ